MRQGGNHASMRKRKVKVRIETKSSTERRLDELRRIAAAASATATGQEMGNVQSLFQTVADHIVLLELKVCLLKAAVSCFHGGP